MQRVPLFTMLFGTYPQFGTSINEVRPEHPIWLVSNPHARRVLTKSVGMDRFDLRHDSRHAQTEIHEVSRKGQD